MTEERVTPLRQRMFEDMRIRGMGDKAQKSRIRAIKDFAAFLGRSPDTATPEDLRAYQLHMSDTGVTPSTFNTRIVALRFFFGVTCGRDEMKRFMQFRTEPRKLPVVFSVEEVSDILMAAPGPGLKYRAALSISYGAGLRAAEVCNLKVGDIDSDRMLIHVEQGKGQTDRKVMLSPGLLELLRAWWREARPEGWLFPGKPKINPISPRQLNRAFTSAKHMAGISKIAAVPYKIHIILTDNGIQFTLPPRYRHCPTASFSTHMFGMRCAENGIEHRLTKVRHPWTNRHPFRQIWLCQIACRAVVERMNRTIKDATVKRFHYDSHDQLRAHLRDFLAAYDFARRLKTLGGLTPYE